MTGGKHESCMRWERQWEELGIVALIDLENNQAGGYTQDVKKKKGKKKEKEEKASFISTGVCICGKEG